MVKMEPNDLTTASRELRGWIKLSQNSENVKKIEAFTSSLDHLSVSFSKLNAEMQAFNENATKSNKFLAKIARLQESMEAQTRAANRVTLLVIGLAILQVVIAAFQYVKN